MKLKQEEKIKWNYTKINKTCFLTVWILVEQVNNAYIKTNNIAASFYGYCKTIFRVEHRVSNNINFITYT